MSRFNLVLADSDEWYIDSLGKFLSGSYKSRFNVNVFTRKELLEEFLEAGCGKTDVLLASPDMIPEKAVQRFEPDMVIVLSDGKKPEKYDTMPCINKYQPGERIVNSIMEIYSAVNSGMVSVLKGSKKTTLISVYSPVGGSGKTTIALNLSIQLSRMGLEVFYLNLESVNTSDCFLKSTDSGHNLSSVLLCLKDYSKRLAVRLESARCFDARFNISYFRPAFCSLELDELTEDDTGRLLSELRDLGQYDVIVADMDSVLNRRNMAVLSGSDSIVLLLRQDVQSKYKAECFEKEIRKIAGDCLEELFSRIIPVINRHSPDTLSEEALVNGKEVKYRIPCVIDIYSTRNGLKELNPDSNIGSCLKEPARGILESIRARNAAG